MQQTEKKLIVWQKADSTNYHVFLITKNFTKKEIDAFTFQLRRAVGAKPVDGLTGFERGGTSTRNPVFEITLGALAKNEYLLEMCFELNSLEQRAYRLEELRKEVGILIWKLYKNR